MNILYTATATSTGGRDGHVKSSDGILDVDLAMPKAMGGPGGAASNPEQLFAAGYAACFHSALKFIARQQHKSTNDSYVTANVSIGKNDAGGYGLAVELRIGLPELVLADAEELAAQAHTVCPYSNATRGNIDVRLAIDASA